MKLETPSLEEEQGSQTRRRKAQMSPGEGCWGMSTCISSLRLQGWGSVSDKHHFHNILLEIEAANLKAAGASVTGLRKGPSWGEIDCKTVVLHLWLASETPGKFVKKKKIKKQQQTARSRSLSLVRLEVGLRICLSDNFPGDADSGT